MTNLGIVVAKDCLQGPYDRFGIWLGYQSTFKPAVKFRTIGKPEILLRDIGNNVGRDRMDLTQTTAKDLYS
jgi:hypothetical protein